MIELVDKYNLAERVMISSFVPRIIDSVISASPSNRKFIIQSLRNRKALPDPANYAIFDQTTGINIMLQYMTEERIKKVQKSGHLVGLWFSMAREGKEDVKVWKQVFTMAGGVNFFYSDRPLESMKARDKFQVRSKAKKTASPTSSRKKTTKQKVAPKKSPKKIAKKTSKKVTKKPIRKIANKKK